MALVRRRRCHGRIDNERGRRSNRRRMTTRSSSVAFAVIALVVGPAACSPWPTFAERDVAVAETAPSAADAAADVQAMIDVGCGSNAILCAGACTLVGSDGANCGACGRRCPAGATCRQGLCAPPCAAPRTQCADGCRDLMSDPRHCGDCGTNCASGAECLGGLCACPAGSVLDAVRGRCVVLDWDPDNCGAVGTRCRRDEWCAQGVCGCRPSFARDVTTLQCDISLNSDRLNCGFVNRRCIFGAAQCLDGVCFGTCSGPDHVASCVLGECINLQTHPDHCGSCGTMCPRTTVCESGICRRYFVAAECATCPCAACTSAGALCCPDPSGAWGLCVMGAAACPVY